MKRSDLETTIRDITILTKRFRPSLISSNSISNNNRSTFSDASRANIITTRQIKIIVLGDVNVGKTSVINKLKYDTFPATYQPTIAIDCTPVTFQIDEEGAKADALIWDTCGSEKFRSITRSYYSNVNGAILLFDVTDRRSFENLSKWIDDYSTYVEKKNDELTAPIIIAGNKSDSDFEKIEVGFVEADNWCSQNGFKYFEVSAKTGYNIKDIFEELAQSVILKKEEKTKLVDSSKIEGKLFDSTTSTSYLDISKVSDKLKNRRETNKTGGCC